MPKTRPERDTPAAAAGDLVLIIDDEPQIRRVVRNAVLALHLRACEAATGESGIDLAAAEHPALIILDVGLPDLDGADVCRALRAFTSAPILVLSARHTDRDKTRLLDAGADDYVTKPFSTMELGARIRAQLRRAGDASAAVLSTSLVAGSVRVDFTTRTVWRTGVEVHLTPTEWNLLRVFTTHAGRTLTHTQLFHAVWGHDARGDAQQYLRVYVGQLRRKLEEDPLRPRLIRTESAVGYRFG